MPGRKFSYSSNYRFGFNGKEKSDEVYGEGNVYDYGFRIYSPRVARFLSVDPLTNSYPWYTPYQFAGNSPVFAIDLDGLEIRNAYYEYSSDGTKLGLINPNDKMIKRLAKKVEDAIDQFKNDDPALFNFANQFNIKIQGATKEDFEKFGLGGNDAGFIKTDIRFNDEKIDESSPPGYAYNQLNGKDTWSKFKESNPEGAAKFATDFKSGNIEVTTSRKTTVGEQNIFIDFGKLDDILSGKMNYVDATTNKPVKGDYGETVKHEIGHFLYQMIGIIYRNKTILSDASTEENFADGLDQTFDNSPSTQTNLAPLFFMNTPPSQTFVIEQANGTQTTSEHIVP